MKPTGSAGPAASLLVRVVRAALVGLLSLFVLYLVAINAFLSTSLFPRFVNAQPDTIEIHFERGWSIVPRHVHARQLSIRGRDSNVEWILRLDAVEFDVSLLGLLRQRFEASNVHGEGLSLRLRKRLETAPSSPDEVASLPPIEGLPPYSVRPPETPSPALWDDAAYNLWTVHLEGIVAQRVHEIWIDRTRFEGDARVDGRFYLKPIRAVEVGPARVDVARGALDSGSTPVAEHLDGSTVDLTLERFDPRTAAGADILHRLSVSAVAHATLPDLARLPLPLPGGLAIRGRATADVTAASAGRRESLAARVVIANLALSRADDRRPRAAFLRASELVATADSSALDLADPLGALHVVVEMPDGEVGQARELSRYIPPKTPVAIAGGRARVSAHVEAWLAEKRASGRGSLRAEDLDVRLAKVHVRGRIAALAAFASYHFDTRRLEGASLKLDVADGALASTAAPDEPLVRLSAARLDAQAPIVDLTDPLRALDVAISMPDADVVSRGLLHAYLPKGADVQTASGHSRFSLESHLAIAEHLARGFLDLHSRELRLAYRDLRLDARVRARARVHDWRWETGDLALDEARIDVDRFAITRRASEDRSAPPAMSIARISVAARSPRFEFERPTANVSLSADLADANVRDSSAVNAFLPRSATFALDADGGHFDARLDVDVENRVARGAVEARATNMGAGNTTLRLRGDVGLTADFVDWKLDEGTMTLLDSRVDMIRVTGRVSARGPPQLSAERIELGVRSPKLDVGRPSLDGADFHLGVERAELPDARWLAPLMPAGGVFGIESGAAHVAADVDVSASRGTATGGVDLAVARGAVRLDETHLSGNFRFRARISGFEPQSERLDLAGTRLEMRDVTVAGASATTSGWWGNVELSPAWLRLAGVPLFDGVVRLDATDARPVLAILFGSSLPRFVVRLIAMPRLVASARIVASAHQLAMLDLDARGGNVALRGSYAARDGHRRGAIIARKAFVSVGLRLDDSGARLRLFGLQRWLRDQTREVRTLLEVQGPR